MSETIALRFQGGPMDGFNNLVEADWPPPDAMQVSGTTEWTEGGEVQWVDDYVYGLIRSSALPDDIVAKVPSLVRGAEYRWMRAVDWQARKDELESFDPDPTTYPEHTFTQSLHGSWCSVCGRQRNEPVGMRWMHTDHAPEGEERLMGGDR